MVQDAGIAGIPLAASVGQSLVNTRSSGGGAEDTGKKRRGGGVERRLQEVKGKREEREVGGREEEGRGWRQGWRSQKESRSLWNLTAQGNSRPHLIFPPRDAAVTSFIGRTKDCSAIFTQELFS